MYLFYILVFATFLAFLASLRSLGLFSKHGVAGIGLFWMLWGGYLFVLQSFLGPIYTPDKFEYSYSVLLLVQIIFVTFLFFVTLGACRAGKSRIFIPKTSFDVSWNRFGLILFFGLSAIFFRIYACWDRFDTLNIIEALSKRSEYFGGNYDNSLTIIGYVVSQIETIFIGLLLVKLVEKGRTLSALVLCIVAGYFSAFSGSKYALFWLVWFVVSMLVIRGSKFGRVFGLFIFLSIILLVPVINIIRSGGSSFDFDVLFSVLIERSDLFFGLADLVRYMDGPATHDLGFLSASFLLRVIPRAFFPDRPGSVEVFLTGEIYNSNSWVMAFGGIGEFYYAFGIFGVALIGFLAGYSLKVINNNLFQSLRDGRLFIFSVILVSPSWMFPWAFGVNSFFGIKMIIWIFSVMFCFFCFFVSVALVRAFRGRLRAVG